MSRVTREQVLKLVGRRIYAKRKDGTVVSGKLVRISGNVLVVETKGKKVRTKAFVPLVLFDLLAIGTAPFYGFGPYGYGGGFGGWGGFDGGWWW
ncbi:MULTISPECIES: 50S ribosomal protein L33 [Cohnella]|uniref:50S ribosomal protein L33 n=1 Tax=Cohnella TaxID=329857 RepID=UPI0009BA7654|nr:MULTISPECIES: 50S ribosomal protein L33 [Cohnella]MBN2980006.1 50S ribosomal protein L33 [Cohnella algarum]